MPYFTLRFIADNGWKIHSVTFNDENVTAELNENNEYMTPAIYVNSHVIVTYEQFDTKVSKVVQNSDVSLRAMSNGVELRNVPEHTKCMVFSLDGMLLRTVDAYDSAFIPLHSGQGYIIKMLGRTFKIML